MKNKGDFMNTKKKKEFLILSIILLSILFICFLPFTWDLLTSFIKHQPLDASEVFIIKFDWASQYVPFYSDFFKSLDSGYIGWNWNYLFGTDLLATKSSLCFIGDLYALIAYLINKFINFVPSTLFIITILKLYISGLTFNFFLNKHNINFKTRIIFSIAFMLSGWSLIFIEHPIFISFYSFLPLVLAGIENILQSKKSTLFIISSSIILMTSYYFTWAFCIYLLLYWCTRYCYINSFNLKNFFKASLKPLSAFLISVLISSIIWLPAFFFMIGSPRLATEGLVNYSFWDIDNILSIVLNFFIPVVKFDSTMYNSYWYYFYQIGIYSGILSLLLIPQFFYQNHNKKEKIAFLCLLVFTILSVCSPKIGYLFHFTYSLRYTFIFTFTFLLISAYSLNTYKFSIKILLITESIMLISMIALGYMIPLSRHLDLSVYYEPKMLLLASLVSLIYCFSIIFIKNKRIALQIILITAFIEFSFQAHVVIKSQTQNAYLEADYLNNDIEVKNIYNSLKEYDPSFYRLILDVNPTLDNTLTVNYGLYYGIPTSKSYDSQYNYVNYDFLDYMRSYPSVDWNHQIIEPNIYELLNLKYSIVRNDSNIDYYNYYGTFLELPSLKTKNYSVYLNNGNFAMAQSFNTFFSKTELLNMSKLDNYYLHEISSILNNNLIVSDEYVEILSKKYGNSEKIYINPIEIANGHIKFNFTLNDDSFLFFSIPASYGWSIKDNGNNVNFSSVNGGFIGLELTKGNHQLEFNYETPGLKIAFITMIIGLLLFITKYYLEVSRKNLKKHN